MGKKKVKIEDIPDDSHDESESTDQSGLAILDSILTSQTRSPQQYNSVLKYVMYATGIFILLSLPFTDRLFEIALPMTSSWLILLGLKTVIFFVAFYIVFQLSKSSETSGRDGNDVDADDDD